MIGEIFVTESKLHGFVSAALFALALLVSLVW